MFRLLTRRAAIKKFVQRLPLDLKRRFGDKRFYSMDEVNRALDSKHYNRAFASYAHALFCSSEEFEHHYTTIGVKCTYRGLRSEVAKRFFHGALDFDALSLIAYAKQNPDDHFYESQEGFY